MGRAGITLVCGADKETTSTDPASASARPASTAPGNSRPILSAAAAMP